MYCVEIGGGSILYNVGRGQDLKDTLGLISNTSSRQIRISVDELIRRLLISDGDEQDIHTWMPIVAATESLFQTAYLRARLFSSKECLQRRKHSLSEELQLSYIRSKYDRQTVAGYLPLLGVDQNPAVETTSLQERRDNHRRMSHQFRATAKEDQSQKHGLEQTGLTIGISTIGFGTVTPAHL